MNTSWYETQRRHAAQREIGQGLANGREGLIDILWDVERIFDIHGCFALARVC